MPRRILQQVQVSTLPQNIGLCAGDLPSISSAVNDATERLLYAGGESGWWGCWDKIALIASRASPFITLPPQYARAINLAVCNFPIRIQNEFYEMIEAGIGLQPFNNCQDWCGAIEGFERGAFSTMVDLPAPSLLRLYMTDPVDTGRRVLIQGAKDQNGLGIYSVDGAEDPNGFYLTLMSPYDTSPFIVSSWASIAKDATRGDVILRAVDPATGVETTLSRYLPWETNPAYRRYYLNNLPTSCCNFPPTSTPSNVAITAMAKLDFRPVFQPTDKLIIGNIPALEEECLSRRYGPMDTSEADTKEAKHHLRAIKLLNEELTHYLGKKQPAIVFAPWGTARLSRQRIGKLI